MTSKLKSAFECLRRRFYAPQGNGVTLNKFTLNVNVPSLQKNIQSERLKMVNEYVWHFIIVYGVFILSVVNRVRRGTENSVVFIQMVLAEFVLLILWWFIQRFISKRLGVVWVQGFYLLRVITYNMALTNNLPFGEVARIDKTFDKSYLMHVLIGQVMFLCNSWQVCFFWYFPIHLFGSYYADVNTHQFFLDKGIVTADPDFNSTLGTTGPFIIICAIAIYSQQRRFIELSIKRFSLALEQQDISLILDLSSDSILVFEKSEETTTDNKSFFEKILFRN